MRAKINQVYDCSKEFETLLYNKKGSIKTKYADFEALFEYTEKFRDKENISLKDIIKLFNLAIKFSTSTFSQITGSREKDVYNKFKELIRKINDLQQCWVNDACQKLAKEIKKSDTLTAPTSDLRQEMLSFSNLKDNTILYFKMITETLAFLLNQTLNRKKISKESLILIFNFTQLISGPKDALDTHAKYEKTLTHALSISEKSKVSGILMTKTIIDQTLVLLEKMAEFRSEPFYQHFNILLTAAASLSLTLKIFQDFALGIERTINKKQDKSVKQQESKHLTSTSLEKTTKEISDALSEQATLFKTEPLLILVRDFSRRVETSISYTSTNTKKHLMILEFIKILKNNSFDSINAVKKTFKAFILLTLQRTRYGFSNTTHTASKALALLNLTSYKHLRELVAPSKNQLEYNDLLLFTGKDIKDISSCNKADTLNTVSSTLSEFKN